MTIKRDIAEERIRIGKAVQKSKLGAAIADRILNPILDAVDKEMEEISDWIGKFVVAHLRENILRSTPSGREYEIVLVESNGDKNIYTTIGKYKASAPGQPPASFNSGLGVPTGTLFDSIDFEIDETGRVRIGVFKSTGTEYTSLFYRGGKIFVSADNGGNRTSVEDYANYLDTGTERVAERPWFRQVLEELRPQIRKMIRERLKRALKRRTRSKGGRTAIYFRVYFDNKKALSESGGSGEEWWEE